MSELSDSLDSIPLEGYLSDIQYALESARDALESLQNN